MKSYKSRIPRLFVVPAIAAAASGTSMGQIVTEDFESYTDGQTIPNQNFTPIEDPPQDPLPANDQILAAAGVGIGGSQGAEFLAPTIPITHRFKINSAGVAGSFYQVKGKFKMAINDTAALTGNHGVIGIGISNQPEWFSGNTLSVNLIRRGPTNLGLSGIGQTTAQQEPWRPVGFEQNAKIGLPNELPMTGETAESDWFTLTLSILDTGTVNVDPSDPTNERTQWDVTGTLTDETGNVVFTLTVNDRLITSNNNSPTADGATDVWAPGDTLYAQVGVPFAQGGSVVLADGGIASMVADDIQIGAVSSTDDDTDMDSYSDAIELANGSDPFDATDDPETLFSTSFTATEGYLDTVVTVDDMGTPDPSDDVTTTENSLQGQLFWIQQQQPVQNTATTGEVCTPNNGFFLRSSWGTGIRGGTNGVGSTEGDFEIGRAIEIVTDYQFTLGDPATNTNLGKFGIVPNTSGNPGPTEGFSAKYNSFNPDTNGGQLKFFADANNENRTIPDPDNQPDGVISVENQFAFFLTGNDAGVDPFNDLGNGVDLQSDELQITYRVAVAGEIDGMGFWTGEMVVEEFKIKNLATNAEFVYDLSSAPEPVGFIWEDPGFPGFPYQDAFFNFQFDRNGAGKGNIDCLNAVTVRHKLVPSIVEPTANLDIVSIQMLDADTVEIQFVGDATTEYKLTSSPDLATPFADTTATNVTTDGSGAGTFTYDLPAPVATKDFFQVSELVPAS